MVGDILPAVVRASAPEHFSGGELVPFPPCLSNNACSRQVGVCAFYRHFPGLGFILLSSRVSSRPLAANAGRWASGQVKVQKKNLAGNCLFPAFSVSGFSFFKLISVCLQESFGHRHLLFSDSLGKSVCRPMPFCNLGWLAV